MSRAPAPKMCAMKMKETNKQIRKKKRRAPKIFLWSGQEFIILVWKARVMDIKQL